MGRVGGVAVLGVDFCRPSAHQVKGRLFCALIHVVVHTEFHPWAGLPELVVVADHAARVQDHARGHEPGSRRHRQVQAHLRLVHRHLVALNALGNVWCSDCAPQENKEFSLHFFCSAAVPENTAANIDLVQPREASWGQTVCSVGHEILKLPVCSLVVSDVFQLVACRVRAAFV